MDRSTQKTNYLKWILNFFFRELKGAILLGICKLVVEDGIRFVKIETFTMLRVLQVLGGRRGYRTVLFYKWQLRVLRAPGGECFGRNDIPYSHIYMFLFIKHLCAIKNTKRRFFNFSEIFKLKYNNVRVEVELKYFAILHLKRCTPTNSYSLNKTVLSKTQKNMI